MDALDKGEKMCLLHVNRFGQEYYSSLIVVGINYVHDKRFKGFLIHWYSKFPQLHPKAYVVVKTYNVGNQIPPFG